MIRPVEAMLDTILALDGRPLDAARPPGPRLVGICRHFTLLAVAIFRQHGAPARARVGFGAYFNPGKYEDHWVCESTGWRHEGSAGRCSDSQFDDVFIRRLSIGHDVLDVPRDRFLVAADAWRSCRDGTFDPQLFGIEFGQLRGLWFVAGNLVGDLAMLNGAEVLPWDVWGMQPPPDAVLSAPQLASPSTGSPC